MHICFVCWVVVVGCGGKKPLNLIEKFGFFYIGPCKVYFWLRHWVGSGDDMDDLHLTYLICQQQFTSFWPCLVFHISLQQSLDFCRRYLSLQSVAEAVVQEIRKILQLQPMLVLATKTNIYGMGAITSDTKRFVHEIMCIHAMRDIACCF